MVDKIRQERGYNYKDVITVSPDKLENYEAKVGALLLQSMAGKGCVSLGCVDYQVIGPLTRLTFLLLWKMFAVLSSFYFIEVRRIQY